jgi:hypothetical protein
MHNTIGNLAVLKSDSCCHLITTFSISSSNERKMPNHFMQHAAIRHRKKYIKDIYNSLA